MSLCKIINFFYACVPLKIWRDVLIRRHGERSPLCQDRLASKEEARSLLVQETGVSPIPPLWPEIRGRLAGEVEGLGEEKRKGRWRWAVGAAAILIAGLASLWLMRSFKPEARVPVQDQAERFRINYLRIENKPGQAYLYKPGESDLIIIWVQKPTQGGLEWSNKSFRRWQRF